MATILVHVTQDHIDKGCKGDSDNCPVALALLNAGVLTPVVYAPSLGPLGGLAGLWPVAGGTAYLDIAVHMPRSVERFIGRFDDGKPVKPFTFKLKIS